MISLNVVALKGAQSQDRILDGTGKNYQMSSGTWERGGKKSRKTLNPYNGVSFWKGKLFEQKKRTYVIMLSLRRQLKME